MQQVNATSLPSPAFSLCPEVPGGPQAWGENLDATVESGNELAKDSWMSGRPLGHRRQMEQIGDQIPTPTTP